jgi:hypothetical protein
MIQEIEISNTTEYLDSSLQPVDFEHIPDIVSAVLTSNGEVMTVKVNRYLREDCVRKVTLSYMLPEYEQQMVAEYELGVFGPSNGNDVDEQTEYVFSLNSVLHQIVHTAPEQLADDTITVRLYTYEANITTDYGTKTLHVPYTVSYPSSMIAPSSTDGWYTVRVLDVQIYVSEQQYFAGDLVYSSTHNGFYTCLVDCLGIAVTNLTYWESLTEEQEHNLYEFGHEQTNSIATVLNANLLVTRYIKQKYIYELLVKSNYKRYDNIVVVMQLEKLFSMREAAVVHLKAGNPIYARYLLDMIAIEVNGFTTNNGERKTTEVITNFTL